MNQYSSVLKRWWCFCKRNRLDIFNIDIPIILSFLSDEFQNGATYRTLNSTRSALAFLLSPSIGSDLKIKRFFKGLQLLRHRIPRYEFLWDPKTVLLYLEKLNSDSLNYSLLSKKLTTLLALATAQRLQTLSLIEYTQYSAQGNWVRN